MQETLSAFCRREERTALLSEWDADANFPLSPDSVTYGSTRKVWWRCKNGHRWQATVNNRTAGRTGCPYCSDKTVWPGDNDLASRYPELAKEWHPTRNAPLRPDGVPPGSETAVWWRCPHGHEWRAQIRSRVNGSGCPVCSNRKLVGGVNDLTTLYPQLAAEWHPTRNGALTSEDVTPGSKRKVWWKCLKGHEWQASIQTRVMDNTGCPVCSGRIVLPGENDLVTRFPEIAREWHPDKNGSLLPTQISPFTKRRVWWRCPLGHDYMASVGARTGKRSGCPYCAGKKVLAGFNDLATTHPKTAAQWHTDLNGSLTPEMVTAGSHKKVWWICREGHVWKAAVYSRTGKQQRGCPVCAGVVNGKRRLRYDKMLEEIRNQTDLHSHKTGF